MWEPRYCPRKYVEGHKSVPVVLSRLYGSARDDTAYRSTYGVWNDDFGLRGCGLWDDVLFQRCHGGGGRSAAERRNINQPILRPTTPRRQFRFDALAAPKRYGQYGPRCKEPRCAAIEHAHKPYCAADKRKERTGDRSTGTVKNTYTTMANIQVQDRIENQDITMGLRNLRKVNEAGELEDILGEEQSCERNCGECSNTGEELMEARATEVKSTRTLGTNTVALYSEREEHEVPVRVLKEQNNNIMKEQRNNIMEEKAPSPTPRVKVTPIPRVALLKAPKPKPYGNLNKLGISQLRTPLKPRVSSPHLTSRRTTPQKGSHQKLMGQGKLAPRILTPPTSIPFTRINTPRSQPSPKPDPNPPPEVVLQPIPPPESTVPSRKSSSEESDSLITTASELDSSSSEGASVESSNKDEFFEEAMICRCSLCGKSEAVKTDGNPAVYRNNPLYSPPQSLTRGRPSPGSSASWRFFYTLLEVLLLVVLGGALTMGLTPYVESVFRAYMADYCRCSGKGVVGKAGAGPELTADGMQNGVVKWVTCMMDDNRVTLTPVRRR